MTKRKNLARSRTFYNVKDMKDQVETTNPNNIINFLKKRASNQG